MMFKFAKPLLYLLISFTIIIAVLYLTRTNKPVSTQCHHRKHLPARFHVVVLFLTSTGKHSATPSHNRLSLPTRFHVGSPNLENLEMDDPLVVRKLRNYFLVPPLLPGSNHVYDLAAPQIKDTSMGQSKIVRDILNNKTNGFFIECGALDGETRSNTLFMERFLNWSGLLIEADPLNFHKMLRKGRKAWLSPTCLSKTTRSQTVTFKQNVNTGRISSNMIQDDLPGYVKAQCFPIYSYLLALNITHVDYFSLDIEGDELDVLQTLPFDKVNIETLSVEFAHVDSGKGALKDFMESKGYTAVTEVTDPNWLANDFIFAKKHN